MTPKSDLNEKINFCVTEECAEYSQSDSFFCKSCQESKGLLPRPRHLSKLVVVLDLDDTLIRTTREISQFTSQFDFTNEDASLFTFKRPHLDTFLNFVFRWYDIYIWTAGTPTYADYILENILDSEKHVPIQILTSLDVLIMKQGCFGDSISIKPLSKIHKDLSRVILIDDKSESFSLHPQNGYKIKGFNNPDTQFNDQELLHCMENLKEFAKLQDVRVLG
jgi:Dullard-like phosphatase family protein